jgi:hypothetical protein
MSREAMQMALHTLEGWANYGKWVWPESALEQAKRNTTESIDALRQALETEQEPVAFINVEKQKLEWAKLTSWHTPTIVNLPKIPLYTAPPKQWVGLTDEQVEDEWERITGHSIFGGDRSEGRAMHISPDEVIEFSRTIEQALKEKNT